MSKVTRFSVKWATSGTRQAAPETTFAQSRMVRLVVMIVDDCSWRRLIFWKKRSTARRVDGLVAELVADEEVGCGVALQASLDGG